MGVGRPFVEGLKAEDATRVDEAQGGVSRHRALDRASEEFARNREIEVDCRHVPRPPVRPRLQDRITRPTQEGAEPAKPFVKTRSREPVPDCAIGQTEPVGRGVGLATVLERGAHIAGFGVQPIDDVRLVGAEPARIAVNREFDHPVSVPLGQQRFLSRRPERFARRLAERLQQAIATGVGLEDQHRLVHEVGQQASHVNVLDGTATDHPLRGIEGEPTREDREATPGDALGVAQ